MKGITYCGINTKLQSNNTAAKHATGANTVDERFIPGLCCYLISCSHHTYMTGDTIPSARMQTNVKSGFTILRPTLLLDNEIDELTVKTNNRIEIHVLLSIQTLSYQFNFALIQ